MTLLSLTRGDSAVFTVTLTESDGSPLDLAGKDLVFTAKRSLFDADEDAVIQKTLTDGITVTDESGGIATVTLIPADTSGLTDLRTLRWDIQVQDGDEVRTPLSGRLAIAYDVTRAVIEGS